jgi:pyruvate/2-oxoglutarate dehydrogenase complex dihydrolipoamide dehydrogenase (E3) component
MVASARVAYMVRRAAPYGISTGPVSVDMQVIRQRKRDIVESWRGGSEKRFASTEGLDLLMGEASFIGTKTLMVRMNDGSNRELTADTICINVGARPATPSIPGLDTVSTLDSTSVMELGEVPEHLLVLGGGYIGLEFGQMFRRFGSQVTIIQRGEQLLPREDADIAEEVTTILRDDGITVLTEANTTQGEQTADGSIQMRVQTPQGEQVLTGSHLLVAVGRKPNADLLKGEAAGLEIDRKGLVVTNEYLETNVPGIYAMGDVKGGPAFTHISYDDFRILQKNLLEGGRTSIAGRMVPYTVFMDPQLGRIGLTEAQAREQGYQVRVARMPMAYVARAIEVDETRGVMKVVVDGNTDQILGASILGIEGGEIASMLQVAMMGKLPAAALREGIFAHPTLAESLNNLFSMLE